MDMKRLPIYIIGLTLFCAFGCKRTQHSNIDDAIIFDTIIKEDNSLLSGDFEDEDSLFKFIEDSIFLFFCNNRISVPENAIKRYTQIDSLLHLIFDCNENEDYYQFNHGFEISQKQIGFLNNYLFQRISEMSNNEFSILLHEEKIVTDSLISAQHKFIKTHIEDAGYSGSLSFIQYNNTSYAVYIDRNKSLKDLYFSLVDNHYRPRASYIKLSNTLIEKEYSHILNELIPRELLMEEKTLDHYDEKADFQAAKGLKQAWNDFIAKRDEIANMLSDKQKAIWENGTSRFQRSHLILLKNEFKNMGVCSNEEAELILSDSCSYEELFTYPNFTTKWNEHIKQFE